ncbi:chemotaxis protein CheB [Alicyclobacillus mali]|uniref:protein-glutamate methylesterase n=1 Tax=Alicyclobacillus mali (ex Roth et al. 2021) TaxID=1123961 RepID=A0ABS0F1R7_9BACL|nr:CheB methylesterase domain-containing protein [Alicyclobacillus mali (ex Roth et al. 2021)]MBF8377222.1 chemotaxis protein CheB [Alicyclobacillus mali (ex Roth et al. 2021)]MCL6488129.1 chemotaxis protein CheB [Alicyclobacillus mali (ex Roth et al. 2021)]
MSGWNGAVRTIIAIGASTGGPAAVAAILRELPRLRACAVVIAQHLPGNFTASFAERLDAQSAWTVREARSGLEVEEACCYIAPGGRRTEIVADGDGLRCAVRPPAKADVYLPSIDALFASVARLSKVWTIGVLLTGMGRDGVEGLRAIRESGGFAIAEAAETAVVDGMPRRAREAGFVDEIIPLGALARRLTELCQGRR